MSSQQLTLLVYTRGQECMGCQSEGVEVSASECLGLQGQVWEVVVSCEGMGVSKILWAVL